MKANKKKTILTGVIILFCLCATVIATFIVRDVYQKNKEKEQKEQEEKLIKEIENKYSSFVKTTKEASLYKKEENTFKKVGTIHENIELELKEDIEIIKDRGYFPLKNIDYYLSYQDVEKIEALTKVRKDYQNYLPFNENVKTESKTNLYLDDQLAYEIEEGIDLPIMIKKEGKYYVEYDNKLLSLKQEEVTTYPNENTQSEEATSLSTIAYHFIYDSTKDTCNQSICHDITQFDSHLNYIKENGFYTLRMNDLELFLDGAIRLPKKSVVITIDDGWYVENAIPILEKYQLNATVFLITRSYTADMFPSEYLEKHSHSNDLHEPGVCAGGQGGGIKCLPRENILNDLKISREKTNGSTVFCYPFYEYNNYAISLLQEAGFTMAFKGGYTKVTRSTNKMEIPRFTLSSTSTVGDLAEIIN